MNVFHNQDSMHSLNEAYKTTPRLSLLHFKPIKIDHTHHSMPTAAAALFELKVYMYDGDILAPLKYQYYETIETGMIENSLPHPSLCERLSGLLSTAHEALFVHQHSNVSYSLKLSNLKIFVDFVGQSMAAKNFSCEISSS